MVKGVVPRLSDEISSSFVPKDAALNDPETEQGEGKRVF